MVAVGCMDNKILLLENCKIISTIVTKSPCSALCYALSDKPEIHLICGTHLGTIQGFSLLNGIVSEQFTIHSNTALSNQMGVQTLSSITHLVYYSDSTGIKLVSACVDGMVQIHSIQLEGDNQSSPKLLSKKNINIFVQSMAVNIYGGALNIPEIMIGERHGGMTALIPLIGSISDLQLALSNLKEDLETCQKGSQHKVTTQTFHGEELNIDVQLNFQPLAGCAILSVNSQDFIYMISCHSSAPIIIGCTEHNESKKGPNSIHLSGLSNLSNLHTSFSVCMQDDTKKCILQLNLLEGRAARLCISVLPMAPNRQCIKQWIDIKPLCHHGRISSLDLERSSMHQLKVSSNMSMLSLHYWVSLLFPGVNEQVQTVSPKIHYYFISEAWGSAVICTIEKGCLQFATNDAITLQFLRENLLALNQAHQSKVDIVSHLNLPVCLDEQIQHLFSTIKAFADAAKNALIHEGLKELEALEGSEGVAACLDEEMKQIWQCNNGKQLQELKKSVDAAISRLETLYISSFELRGMAVGGNCEQFSRQLREAVHIMEERGHNPLSFDIVRHFFYSNSP
ncbi:hypothetical protein BC830DRAFT_841609 [Chytriomyces sp. MP71]|nr:hypothetical protein BC830DRAFT_841609 [Chytriomyces sp. MP71]